MSKGFLLGFLFAFILSVAGLVIFFSFIKVPKEKWIEKFKLKAPAGICQMYFDNERLDNILKSHNISYEKCVSLASESMERCISKYSSEIPSKMNIGDGKKWGTQIGRCAGGDFYDNNLSGTVNK